MSDRTLNFIHRFIPSSKSFGKDKEYGNNENESPSLYPTLLLLHGTGGSEDDLIPLGHTIYPNANLLSPRGKVLEHGMPRFFRRLAEGVFDMEDLKFRTAELAKFVYDVSIKYSFDLSKTIAVGFSNGANIATSLLLLEPPVIAGAALFRPMVPFIPDPLPDLSEKKSTYFIGAIRSHCFKKTSGRFIFVIEKCWCKSGNTVANKWT